MRTRICLHLLSLFPFLFSVCSLAEQDVVITLEQGKIQGMREPVPGGYEVEIFLGIPYARAPVGELRFADPQPPLEWTGIRDAKSYRAVCPQAPFLPNFQPLTENDTISEDCLFLNVYRPTKFNHKLPVMVWIHGGGYYHATANWFDGSVLASHNNVIVVTINYRLALLGFLHIPGTQLRGNYGMLDQVQALKWVQQNIASFGGNPSHVTLFGESSGAASVTLHILSPLSAGLFQTAIIESGSAVSPFGAYSPRASNHYDVFIERLGCFDKENLLNCLREKPFEDFERAVGGVDPRMPGPMFPVPTVDKVFLPDEPEALLLAGRFNKIESVIIGFNKDEGTFLYSSAEPVTYAPPSIGAFHKAVHEVTLTQNGDDCELLKQAAIHRYTNHSDPSNPWNLWENWKNLMGDTFFFAPVTRTANSLAKAGISTYMYLFTHRSTFSMFPPETGVCHFVEVQYVFGSPWKPNPKIGLTSGYTEVERGLSSFLMKLWTDFAKNRDPNETVTWPLYSAERQKYLEIDLVTRVRRMPHADRVAFWNKFVPKLKQYCQGRGETPL